MRERSKSPWAIVEDGAFGVRLEDPDGGIIALNPETVPDDPDWLLLVAATDLLVACQAAITRCPGLTEYGHGFSRTSIHGACCSDLRAVVRKARGDG